jgi:hypothetical protein
MHQLNTNPGLVPSTPLLSRMGAAMLLCAVSASPGLAQASYAFDFNTNAVMPDSHPNVVLFNNSTSGAVYTVAGGFLRQRSFALSQGNVSYNSTGVVLDPALDIVMEAKLRVLVNGGVPLINGEGGAFFQASDGVHRYSVFFTATGVSIKIGTGTGTAYIPVNVTLDNEYRIESPANSGNLSFWVNNVLMFSGVAALLQTNGFGWGDGVTLGGNGADVDWDYVRIRNSVGASLCSNAVPNSTNYSGMLSAGGSAFVAANNLRLNANCLPLNSSGYFLTSQTNGFAPNAGGSQGNLCIAGGPIGRYVGPGQVLNSGSAGSFSLPIDLTQHPTPLGFVAVAPGETWNFQCWYRDTGSTSNFTDALQVMFL